MNSITEHLSAFEPQADSSEINPQHQKTWGSWFDGEEITHDFIPEREQPDAQTRDDN
ncbi:AbrB/MazE/SpoVT family DNA-binding domain-containing protein [Pectobacterium brasiliense]|uniref:hypothetical protein n=1 Tax=Pectobacterium brasiliense TaxID=180957 RepID=UPI000A840C76|nr:hypothetical protein [Pectobacterium brasiliense]